MGILSRWRFSRFIAGVVLAFGLMGAAREVKASYSSATVDRLARAKAQFEVYKEKESPNSKDMKEFGASISDLIRSIAKDLLADIKDRKWRDILEEYETMRHFVELAESLGDFSSTDVQLKVNEALTAAVKEAQAEEERQMKLDKMKKEAPEGVYVYSGDGFTGSCEIRYGDAKSNLDRRILFEWKGRVPTREEWVKSKEGKPDACNQIVEARLFTSRMSKLLH